MAKVALFHAQGTSYTTNYLGLTIPSLDSLGKGPLLVNGSPGVASISGVGGFNATWDFSPPADPFVSLFDPQVWDAKKVPYPASLFPGGLSITDGVNSLVSMITSMPAGQKFCLAGYSQGAAVCSMAYRMGLQPGTTGVLEPYRSQFLGATTFGNPMRAENHRGAVGGTWSGCWDNPGSTTGGHGCFPLTNTSFPRMSTAEDKWVDFVGYNDPVTATGNSTNAVLFSEATDDLMELTRGGIISLLSQIIPKAQATAQAMAFSAIEHHIVDARGNYFTLGGGGHTAYSVLPPPNNSDGSYAVTTQVINGVTYSKAAADTMYQVAVKYLNSLAAPYVTASAALPSTPTTTLASAAGWSTSLLSPSA